MRRRHGEPRLKALSFQRGGMRAATAAAWRLVASAVAGAKRERRTGPAKTRKKKLERAEAKRKRKVEGWRGECGRGGGGGGGGCGGASRRKGVRRLLVIIVNRRETRRLRSERV